MARRLRTNAAKFLFIAIMLAILAIAEASGAPSPSDDACVTPLQAENLDDAAFTEWVDGAEKRPAVADGARRVMWTRNSRGEWDGITFGNSKTPGARHLRIAVKSAIPVGSVLTCGGGVLSVLKPEAAYPGRLDNDADWLPAERMTAAGPARQPGEREDFVLWVLPPRTTTRALRFTHVAAPTDTSYAGYLGGAYVLAARMVNAAARARVVTSAGEEAAAKINNGSNDGTWAAWDNGKDGGSQVVSSEHPVDVLLVWPNEVKLDALCVLWTGFGECVVDAYRGPADRHPRMALEADWQRIGHYRDLPNGYPYGFWPNWFSFKEPVTARAVRLRIIKSTVESHPHLTNKTRGGTRVWLGELLALQPLGDAALCTAVADSANVAADHPPIAIPFTLEQPGRVTLVIEDPAGKRVRNLLSETPFPAGRNVAWWDGMDDLGRDTDAAHHGIYRLPARLVAPGNYRVRGLVHQAIDLRYEFSVYNAGNPPWKIADGTGGWLTNHTPPQAALFVPAETAPTGKPLVYLGSYVSEGGDGLAWVDLDGKKQGGVEWVGGVFTGAPFLARDAGARRDATAFAYVASSFSSKGDGNRHGEMKGEVRLTALTPHGDRSVLKYVYDPPKHPRQTNGDVPWGEQLGGLAVHDATIVLSMTRLNELVFVDATTGRVVAKSPLHNPRGMAFDRQGRLLILSGEKLYRFAGVSKEGKIESAETFIENLDDPQQIALDVDDNIYVSDRGASHQVKVFDPHGKPLRTIGKPGVPKAGPYDALHMNNPAGMTIDARGHLWVTECDFQPKRVSVWTLDGKILKAFYGPSEYGGGGALDPEDRTRFYYHGMKFRLDWKSGTNQLENVLFRPGRDDLHLPENSNGSPETAIYRPQPSDKRQRYFTNCYNSNPVGGASIATIWIDRSGVAVPVAALGRAIDWKPLREERFRSRWPAGIDLTGDMWKNQTMFAWSDLNGDGHIQPDEVVFWKASSGGITVMPDLSIIAARVDGNSMRYPPRRFTEQGVPVYDPAASETLAVNVAGPASSGGDQALWEADGWTVLTIASKPFAPESICGVYHGRPMWSYPSPWPGLHASHESPPPDRRGELIGTTRLLGGFVRLNGDVGPLWCVNGNMGNMYLFTADGLFVSELFRDVRKGGSWAMPTATRGMRLNDVSPHDENFWPSITAASDGNVYVVDGARTCLVRLDGLDKLRCLPSTDISVSEDDLQQADEYGTRMESQRQRQEGVGTLKVALRTSAPKVDGKLDDWSSADWAIIDRSGVGAFFDSNTKPYDVTAALAVSGDGLYAAFRTGDPRLLKNSGETPQAPFKTGGCLDLMLGASHADDRRQKPAGGDLRLVVTQVNGKTRALVYRPVSPAHKDPVLFSSPWRSISMDRVEDVSAAVQLAASDGNYEFSIPLSILGLKSEPGLTIRGDIGILRGNGSQTLHRVYWSNKATGIVSDVPSEAELTPQLWGQFRFERNHESHE